MVYSILLHFLSYPQLISWSRVLNEELRNAHLVKKTNFPCRIMSSLHNCLSFLLMCILTYFLLCLDLNCGLFLSNFPTEMLYPSCLFQCVYRSNPSHSSEFCLSISIWWSVKFVKLLITYIGWSFNSGTDFFRGSYNTQRSDKKAGQVATLCKCTCITGSHYLPACALWKPLSECLSAVCVTSHDGGDSSAACMNQFLFPSGDNWCWNVRNAASSFRRVLPKSIEDIWVVFTFQKWTPILWGWPPPRQAVHLPHGGDRGTCARNHSRWPTSDYQRGCRGCWNSIRYGTENFDWRFANETCVS